MSNGGESITPGGRLMELTAAQQDLLGEYLCDFGSLIGDHVWGRLVRSRLAEIYANYDTYRSLIQPYIITTIGV
jgi:hypothetical protein